MSFVRSDEIKEGKEKINYTYSRYKDMVLGKWKTYVSFFNVIGLHCKTSITSNIISIRVRIKTTTRYIYINQNKIKTRKMEANPISPLYITRNVFIQILRNSNFRDRHNFSHDCESKCVEMQQYKYIR